jgi:amino acid adenylation domain-containing protein
MQQRLWFLEQTDPGLTVFNLPAAYRIEGPLDAHVLERSLATVVVRHEVLRTTLAFHAERPVQVVADRVPVSLKPVDLTHLPGAAREEEALVRIRREANVPFDLSEGPLFRASLYRLDVDRHVFFFMAHESIWDGRSFDILMRELDAHYAAFGRGAPAVLPEPLLQYGEFAEWHLARLQRGELARQSAHRMSKFHGRLAPLELPTDHPRPQRRTGDGGFEPFRMPEEQTASLVDVARSCRVTPFMLLLAAFSTLLRRLTGQSHLVIGVPADGRSRRETEGLLGLFTRTLPLRIDSGGAPSFRELLLRVRTTCSVASANPDMRFELLRAFVSCEDARVCAESLGALRLTRLELAPDSSPTDVALRLVHRKDGLVGGLSYSSDLFDAGTGRRMLAGFRTVLRAALTDVDQPIDRLAVLSEDERAVIAQSNETRADHDGTCAHTLVAAKCAATPDAVAVTDGQGLEITYGEVLASARSVARQLRQLGVGRGARVGVCFERSALVPVALLGVLEAGAAYVPLDPAFPRARLSFMVTDAALAALVTTRELSDKLPCELPRITLDGRQAGDLTSVRELEQGARPEDPAYVLYTSGSTGVARGVLVPHRGLTNLLLSMSRAPGISSGDVLVAVTTSSFDIATLDVFLPLIHGARVVVASRDTVSSGAALLSLVRRSGATVLQATPGTWRMLVAAGLSDTDGLRVLSAGGEALSVDLARALAERSRDAWNLYGPTETTIYATAWRLPPLGFEKVLIGRPIDNTRCYVLDGLGQEVPIGVAGELYIGGEGVALGYLARPEETARHFVDDPFAGPTGGKMYRTGDMVRRLADGSLEYLCRSEPAAAEVPAG